MRRRILLLVVGMITPRRARVRDPASAFADPRNVSDAEHADRCRTRPTGSRTTCTAAPPRRRRRSTAYVELGRRAPDGRLDHAADRRRRRHTPTAGQRRGRKPAPTAPAPPAVPTPAVDGGGPATAARRSRTLHQRPRRRTRRAAVLTPERRTYRRRASTLSDDAAARRRGRLVGAAVGGSLGLLLSASGRRAAHPPHRPPAGPDRADRAPAQRRRHDARAPTDGPREIAEVGAALNRLADRIDELIAEERETVADLSHRLRTPLTALRLDAEALRDPAEAERVGTHVSVLERMLTAVIHAARRPQREGRMPSCDATAVVGERVAFWSALAEDQGARPHGRRCPTRRCRCGRRPRTSPPPSTRCWRTSSRTPRRARRSQCGLTAPDDGAHLEVGDDGPGMPADALVRGRSDRGSTGLGLDIARRCAEASGGSMTIGTHRRRGRDHPAPAPPLSQPPSGS